MVNGHQIWVYASNNFPTIFKTKSWMINKYCYYTICNLQNLKCAHEKVDWPKIWQLANLDNYDPINLIFMLSIIKYSWDHYFHQISLIKDNNCGFISEQIFCRSILFTCKLLIFILMKLLTRKYLLLPCRFTKELKII